MEYIFPFRFVNSNLDSKRQLENNFHNSQDSFVRKYLIRTGCGSRDAEW